MNLPNSVRFSACSQYRHAYLVISHGRPEQILRLLTTLRKLSPSGVIVLHHDARWAQPDPETLNRLDVKCVSPRLRVEWADYSMMEAVLAVCREALSHPEVMWLTLLSGADYPLRPLAAIEKDLETANFDAYVEAESAAGSPFMCRYTHRFIALPRFPYWHHVPPTIRRHLAALRHGLNRVQRVFRIFGGPRKSRLRVGVYWPWHPFGPGFQCYKGSMWFTMSRKATDAVFAFLEDRPESVEHFRHTAHPDEMLIPTIIHNQTALRVYNGDRRFIKWPAHQSSHPITLGRDDLKEMLQSGKDFARKFDVGVDAAVLDALDQRLFDGEIGSGEQWTQP